MADVIVVMMITAIAANTKRRYLANNFVKVPRVCEGYFFSKLIRIRNRRRRAPTVANTELDD